MRRFDQAIDAARELCADSKEVRDRMEMGVFAVDREK